MTDVPEIDPRLRELVEGWPLFDNAIIRHGFAPFMRDYDVVVDAGAAAPDGSASFIEGRYRFRFTHCVSAHTSTVVGAESWRQSWADCFTDHAEWERAGAPKGYVWGVEYMDAFPGARWLEDSALAQEWSQRLGTKMHEVLIATNCQEIRIVFHSLLVHRIGCGNPVSRSVDDVAPEDLLDLIPATSARSS